MKIPRILQATVAMLLAGGPVFSATDIWDGNSPNAGVGDSNIATGLNWVDDGAPVSDLVNTDLIFGGTTKLTPNFSAAFSADSVTFNNTSGAFTLGGGALTIGTTGIINNDVQTQTFANTVLIGTAASTFNAASGGLTLGSVLLGTNSLTLSGSGGVTIGALAGAGTVTKTSSDTLTLTASGTAIGADLNLNAGGTTIAASPGVTQFFSGTSTVAVGSGTALSIFADTTFDAGAQLTRANTGTISIGAAATLTFQGGSDFITTGGYNFTSGTLVATGAGSTLQFGGSSQINSGASMSVLAGAAMSVSNFLDIGTNGTGTLLVSGAGSTMTAATTSFWGSGGGTANVTFSNDAVGNFTSLELARALNSNATVQVNAGADVTGATLNIANVGVAANGAVTVDGAGSTWTQLGASSLTIGGSSASTGALTLTNGGVFNTGTGGVTINATGDLVITSGTFNSLGDITVTGAGASLTRGATGVLSVASGKLLAVQNGASAFLDGNYTTAGSNIRVDGTNSFISMIGALTMNNGSTVTVQNGGSLNVGGLNIGGSSGGTLVVDQGTMQLIFGGSTWDGNGPINATFSNNAAVSFGALTIATNAAAATMNVNSGADVTQGGTLTLGTGTGNTTVTVDGSGSTFTKNGQTSMTLGTAAGNTATFAVQNGGLFTFNGGNNGSITINPTGRLNLNGGTFAFNGARDIVVNGGQINRNGSGTLTMSAGRIVVQAGGDVAITGGYQQLTLVDLSVSGAGSTFTTTGDFQWEGGDNTLAVIGVRDGALLSAGGALHLGRNNTAVSMSVSGAGARAEASASSTSEWEAGVLVVNGGTVSLGGLRMSDTAFFSDSQSSLNVFSGSTVTVGSMAAATVIDDSRAEIEVKDAGSSITQTGASTLTLGAEAVSIATVTVGAGGTFSTGTGTVTLNPTGSIILNGGTLNINGTIVDNGGTFTFTSGVLNMVSNLTIGTGGLLGEGDLTMTADKSLTTTGTTTISALRTLKLDGGTFRTGALVNNGTLDFQRGTLGITGAGGFNIGTGPLGAEVTLGTSANLQVTSTATIASGASLTVDGGSFTAGVLSNSGLLDHRRGSLVISGATTNAAGGDMFIARPMTTNGTILNQVGGRITLADGLGKIGGAGSISNLGLITGEGTVAVQLNQFASGKVRVDAGKTLLFTASTGANNGELQLQGGTLEISGFLVNGSSGFVSGRGALITGGIINSGVMAFSAGSTDIRGDVTNSSGARIVTSGAGATTTFFDDVVHNGTEIFTGAGASSVFFGSTTGAGPFTGTGTVYNNGDLRPGNSPALVSYGGALVLGNGTLTMELGGKTRGTQYDGLNIAGAFATDGTLSLMLLNGFNPVLGDVFDLFDTGSTSGTFDSLLLPSLAQFLTWDTSTLYKTGTVQVTSTLTPIEQWRLLHFGSPANVGDAADTNDFDRDGFVNLIEYGLAMDPEVPNVEGRPVEGIVNVGGSNFLSLTIVRPLSATDVSYRFQVGGTLLPGSDGSLYSAGGDVPSNAFTTQVSRSNDGTIETIVVRDNTPISSATSRFMQVKILNP